MRSPTALLYAQGECRVMLNFSQLLEHAVSQIFLNMKGKVQLNFLLPSQVGLNTGLN